MPWKRKATHLMDFSQKYPANQVPINELWPMYEVKCKGRALKSDFNWQMLLLFVWAHKTTLVPL